jgi:hypothetical protein
VTRIGIVRLFSYYLFHGVAALFVLTLVTNCYI